MSAVELTERERAIAEAMADIIADRVQARQSAPRFVDAKELAAILGVSIDAVYASQDQLGGKRVGKKGSRRPRLVFDVATALASRQRLQSAHESRPTATPRRESNPVPLLPIKG